MSVNSYGLGKSQIGELEASLANMVFKRQSLFRFESKSVNSFCHSLENKVTRSFNAAGALGLPSASVAFSLIIEALELPPGSLVLTSPFSWVAVYSTVLRHQLTLGFYQVDDLFNLNIEQLEAQIQQSQPKLILVPHLMGRGIQNIAQVQQLAEKYHIPLVEDIAQSFGVKIGEQYAGSFGTAAYTSFNHHKILSAGDGGMAIFKSDNTLKRAWQYHDQGCLPDGNRRKVRPDEFIPGTSLRMNELTGAVLNAQYARLYYIRSRVWKIYNEVATALTHHGLTVIPAAPGDIPFMALFYHSSKVKHCPTLLDSGWHVFSQIPFEQPIKQQLSTQNQQAFENQLAAISVIGCGFMDKYFSTPYGIELSIADEQLESTAVQLVESILC